MANASMLTHSVGGASLRGSPNIAANRSHATKQPNQYLGRRHGHALPHVPGECAKAGKLGGQSPSEYADNSGQ